MKRGAFETGTYRNVFAEAGYDKETIEKRKNEIFHTLFYGAESERIYHPVEDDMAYIEDTGNHDAADRRDVLRHDDVCPDGPERRI